MSADNLGKKAVGAAKWSVSTQLVIKLIGPVTTMILARILTPEAFGIVATATMVFTLADLFSDAGFQKYLIHKQFKTTSEESLNASVAFWTNISISTTLLIIISIFNAQITSLIGSEGYGSVLILSVVSLPLTALISVQTAIYQKKLDFKTLFGSQVTSKLLILFISIPLAIAGMSYWSIVIGTLCSNVFLAFWLTLKSDWKPKFEYSFLELKGMFSFSGWVLLETFLGWISGWIGVFIISHILSSTFVGYYRTSISMSLALTGIIWTALLPIIFSSLSKVQNDKVRFNQVFYSTQKLLAFFIVPIAFSAYIYRDLLTKIILGTQWMATSTFFGLHILSFCMVILFGNMCVQAYRAKGKTLYPAIVQFTYLIPLGVTLYFSSKMGWETFSIVASLIQLLLPLINLALIKFTLNLSPLRMLINTKWTYVQAILAIIPGIIITNLSCPFAVQLISLIISIAIYLALACATKSTRLSLITLLEKLGWANGIVIKLKGIR
jgi:PST family polysaccharide transporter